MRRISFFITLLLLLTPALSAKTTDIPGLKQLIKEGQFSKAQVAIRKSLSTDDITPIEKGELYNLQGLLYDRYTGDLPRSISYYKLALEQDLPSDNPVRIKAETEIARLTKETEKFAKEFTFLRQGASQVTDTKHPNFPYLKSLVRRDSSAVKAKAHFFLSKAYLKDGKNMSAYFNARKAQKLKPVLDLSHPLSATVRESYKKFFYGVTEVITTILAIAIPVLILIFFLISKPWRWFTGKHLIIYVLYVTIFSALFTGLIFLVGQIKDIHTADYPIPVYITTFYQGYGDSVVSSLVALMVLGICFLTLYLLTQMRKKKQYFYKTLGVSLAILLFTSLISVFYAGFVNKFGLKGAVHTFYPSNEDETFSYFEGISYFKLKDAKPHVLTNPRKHDSLYLAKLNEKVFLEWLLEQYRIIAKEKESEK